MSSVANPAKHGKKVILPKIDHLTSDQAIVTMAKCCRSHSLPGLTFKLSNGKKMVLLNLLHLDNRGILPTDIRKIHASTGVEGIWIAKAA